MGRKQGATSAKENKVIPEVGIDTAIRRAKRKHSDLSSEV